MAAKLSFVTAGVFLVLLAAMHFLKPEFNPTWHMISEYEIGRYGWLMQAAFLGVALSCVTLAWAMYSQVRTIAGPDRKDETYRNGNLGGIRQWIESVNQTLKAQLDLEQHGGRTPHGVFIRVAQRLLAMAAGIWHNWTTGVTSKRSLIAFDH
jgi:hypothetical protein